MLHTRPPRASLVLAVLALSSLLAAGCDAYGISAAQDRWDDHRPSAYSYDWEQSCFCSNRDTTRRMHISVTEYQITSAYFSEDQVVIPDAAALGALTVNGVFDELATRLQEGGNDFTLKFDRALGYPTSVYVNNPHGPADGEFAVTLSSLVSDAP